MEKNFNTIVNETINKINNISNKQLKLSKYSDAYDFAKYESEGELFDMENIHSAKAFLFTIKQTYNSFMDKRNIAMFGISKSDCHDLNVLAEVYNYFYDLLFGEVA